MSTSIRTGVIGVGSMGQHHARILATLPGSHLVGVADSDGARAREIAARHGVSAYTDYRELLDRVDAVSVAAPTAMHCEIGLACLARGVHVVMEKPLAATLGEAHQLVEAASQMGLVLLVGHIERFNPTFAELANVLAGRQVLALEARRLSFVTARTADVSVVYDLMVHDLDLVLKLIDAPLAHIHASGRRSTSPHLDHAVALLTFAGGEIASLSASKVTQHKVRQLSVACAESFVVADLLARTVMVYRQATADYQATRGEVLYRQEALIEQVHVPPIEPLYAELQHFLQCVSRGTKPQVGGEDALRVMDLAAMIEERALASLDVRG